MKVLSDEIVKALAIELKMLGHDKQVAMGVVHMMRTEEQAHRMLKYLQSEQPEDVQLIYTKMEEIWGLVDFSKRSETLEYWKRLLPVLKDNKIKSIFTLYAPMWSHYDGHRTYNADTEVYILFEDDMCLVINYLFIDSLGVEYRPLLKEECEAYKEIIIKDFFNSINEIHDSIEGGIIEAQTVALEYDSIESIFLNSVTYEYGKWINHGIEYVQPTSDTFDKLEIRMKNGKSISLCPQDVDAGGYVMIWSEDAIETIEKK